MAYWTADFVRDGSLRDIYVLDTTLDDWHTFLDLVAGKLMDEGVEVARPDDVATLFEVKHLLVFYVGRIFFSCHFFARDEIEMSFGPEDIDEQSLPELLAFVSELAAALRKTVIVTPENCPEQPI